MKRKILCGIAGIILSGMIMFAGNAKLENAYAATATVEKENNNGSSTANKLSVNQVCQGKLSEKSDQDWYKITVTGNGYAQVKFTLDSSVAVEEVGDGWTVIVYDSKLNELKKVEEIKSNYTGVKLPMSAGTYYIKVAAYKEYLQVPVDMKYNISMVFKSDSTWETEYNDKSTTADKISVNKTYKGTLWSKEDCDWYRFTVDNNGYGNFKFKLDSSVNLENVGDGWTIIIYDSNLQEIKKTEGITSGMSGVKLPIAKGTYYIKVCAYHEYLTVPVDSIYTLQFAFTSSSLWETEYNNSSSKADSISKDKTYTGTLWTREDQDWYKIYNDAKGSAKLYFSVDSSFSMENAGDGWAVTVYDSGMKEVYYSGAIVKRSKSINLNLKKGRYYVKVEAYASYLTVPVDGIYHLKYNYCKAPSVASIKSLTSTKNSVTLKWNRSYSADGYYIYKSSKKDGTYTKVATVKGSSKVKYTNTGLKKNTKYYYKIVAYKTLNGITAKSSDSQIKAVTTLKK